MGVRRQSPVARMSITLVTKVLVNAFITTQLPTMTDG